MQIPIKFDRSITWAANNHALFFFNKKDIELLFDANVNHTDFDYKTEGPDLEKRQR